MSSSHVVRTFKVSQVSQDWSFREYSDGTFFATADLHGETFPTLDLAIQHAQEMDAAIEAQGGFDAS